MAARRGRGLADGNVDRSSSTRHAAIRWRRAKQREGVVVKVGFEEGGIKTQARRGFANVDGLLEPRQTKVLVGLLSNRWTEANRCDRSRVSRWKARLVTRGRRVMQRRRAIGIIKHRPWLIKSKWWRVFWLGVQAEYDSRMTVLAQVTNSRRDSQIAI